MFLMCTCVEVSQGVCLQVTGLCTGPSTPLRDAQAWGRAKQKDQVKLILLTVSGMHLLAASAELA